MAKEGGDHWLVCVDGSKNAEAAFNLATSKMHNEFDKLSVMMVGQPATIAVTAAFVATDFHRQHQEAERKHCNHIVRQYIKKAKALGIKDVSGLVGFCEHAGELLCETVEQRGVTILVAGRRGMTTLQRTFHGSTSKYLVEHCDCHVVVVKGEYGPQEEHYSTLQEVIDMEEEERAARIAEMDAQEHTGADVLEEIRLLADQQAAE